jgi:hypothetical protein
VTTERRASKSCCASSRAKAKRLDLVDARKAGHLLVVALAPPHLNEALLLEVVAAVAQVQGRNVVVHYHLDYARRLMAIATATLGHHTRITTGYNIHAFLYHPCNQYSCRPAPVRKHWHDRVCYSSSASQCEVTSIKS